MYLSQILLACATAPTIAALALGTAGGNNWATTVAVAALGYSGFVGYLTALACTDAMAHKSTGMMFKNARDGNISLLSWALWWPYHLGLRAKLYIGRWISSEPLYDKIMDGFYLGGWVPNHAALPADDDLSVVDVTCELPRTHAAQRYCCLPTWDTQAPSPDLIEKGARYAATERLLGHAVYVHCAHGHGRSALILLAALMELGHVKDIDEGIRLLQATRPKVRLNRRQRASLETWHRSRKMLAMTALPAAAPSAAISLSASATLSHTHGHAHTTSLGSDTPLDRPSSSDGLISREGILRRDSGGDATHKKAT